MIEIQYLAVPLRLSVFSYLLGKIYSKAVPQFVEVDTVE